MEKSYLHFEEYRCALVADKIQSLADLSYYRLPFATEKQINDLFTDSSSIQEEIVSESDKFQFGVYHDLFSEKYLIAFAGTDPIQPMHWINNIRQWAGLNAEMYERGVELLGRLKYCQRERVLLTGHSLGGGIATMAAIVHKVKAIVFNPPGIHVNTLAHYDVDTDNADSFVQRFVVRGEILDLINHIPLTQIKTIGTTQKIEGGSDIPLHKILALMVVLKHPAAILGAPLAVILQKTIDLHKMSEVFIGLEKWCDVR